jgi:hypothetical protein
LYRAYIYTLVPLEPVATFERASVMNPDVEAMAVLNSVRAGTDSISKVLNVLA